MGRTWDELLDRAACAGDGVAVREALAHGASPEGVQGRGARPLLACIVRQCEAGVSALLDAGADPGGPVPVVEAARSGNLAILTRLLDAPGISREDLSRALSEAAQAGQSTAVRILSRAGAHANRMEDGNTPAHRAAAREDAEVLEALLEAGADVHQRSILGYCPLDLAARARAPACLSVLLAGTAHGPAELASALGTLMASAGAGTPAWL